MNAAASRLEFAEIGPSLFAHSVVLAHALEALLHPKPEFLRILLVDAFDLMPSTQDIRHAMESVIL
jgi:hypothetical protein